MLSFAVKKGAKAEKKNRLEKKQPAIIHADDDDELDIDFHVPSSTAKAKEERSKGSNSEEESVEGSNSGRRGRKDVKRKDKNEKKRENRRGKARGRSSSDESAGTQENVDPIEAAMQYTRTTDNRETAPFVLLLTPLIFRLPSCIGTWSFLSSKRTRRATDPR